MAGDGDTVAILGEAFPIEVIACVSTEFNSLALDVLLVGDSKVDCKLLITKIFEPLGRFWGVFLTDVFTVDFVGCRVETSVVRGIGMF